MAPVNPSKLKRMAPFLSFLLLGAALWSLGKMLHHYRYQDVVKTVHGIPSFGLFLALACTAGSYAMFALYDALALRYIRHPLPWKKVAFASFLGNAFTTGLGNAFFFGGPLRFRLYSSWGLTVAEITKVILFCSQTLWIGFMAIAGLSFLIEPVPVPSVFSHRLPSLHVVGLLLILPVLAYGALSVFRRKPVRVWRWDVGVPSPSLSAAQTAVASVDWAVTAGALYFLLPSGSGLPFPAFLGIFLFAQVIGIASQVPAGLGVFEWVILTFLSPRFGAPPVVGALIAYRFVYYFFPLALAVCLLATHELWIRRGKVTMVARGLADQISSVAPTLLAVSTFIGGAILLVSGATPAAPHRMEWLKRVVPLPVVELSHFLGSIAGVGLLLLARGLQRRLDGAFLGATALLTGGVAFSMLKGLDFEEALILSFMLAALVATRREFYRRSSLFGHRFSKGWWLSVFAVVAGSVWLGLFAFKHVEYSNELWWRFALHGHAPRFLRASVGAAVILLVFSVSQLVKPALPTLRLPSREELEKIAPIVRASEKAVSHLAFLGDKHLLMSQSGNAFVMFAVQNKDWVAMGSPVGPPEEAPELVWEFLDMVDDYGGDAAFYEIDAPQLPLYVDAGLTVLKLGEEARVPLRSFSLEGSSRKSFRYTVNKLKNQGCSFSLLDANDLPALMPRLKEISESWLGVKNIAEKGFSLGFFNDAYLVRGPVGVINEGGRPVAFANVWRGAGKEEFSVDLMRFDPAAPHGVMEFLMIHLMLQAKRDGYRWFNLGMAPLAGLNKNHPSRLLWEKVGAFLYEHGERFYNFQGLRQYKEKFDPVWEPKYLATTVSSVVRLPLLLTDIAALISGGYRGLISKEAPR